jgi:hypothetical protein
MNAHSHWLPPLAVIGIASVDGAAAAGATPLHFAAVGATIVGIAVVLQGWRWVRAEVGEQIGTAIEIHNAKDETRHEKVLGEVAKIRASLDVRPCIACKVRED